MTTFTTMWAWRNSASSENFAAGHGKDCVGDRVFGIEILPLRLLDVSPLLAAHRTRVASRANRVSTLQVVGRASAFRSRAVSPSKFVENEGAGDPAGASQTLGISKAGSGLTMG